MLNIMKLKKALFVNGLGGEKSEMHIKKVLNGEFQNLHRRLPEDMKVLNINGSLVLIIFLKNLNSSRIMY